MIAIKNIFARLLKVDRKKETVTFEIGADEMSTTVTRTFDELHEESERRNNPDSCEREHNENEIKLPVKSYRGLGYMSSDDGDIFSDAISEARFAGYNHFIIPKRLYERYLQKIKEFDEETERLKNLKNKT